MAAPGPALWAAADAEGVKPLHSACHSEPSARYLASSWQSHAQQYLSGVSRREDGTRGETQRERAEHPALSSSPAPKE